MVAVVGAMITMIHGWMQANPTLLTAIWFQIGLALFAIAAMLFDRRKILGLNPWIKPLKFDLSVAIFLFTMAGILSGIKDHARARWWIGSLMGIVLALENAIISLQSLRGQRSHMNFSTPLNTILFQAMGLLIAINTGLVLWTAALIALYPTHWAAAVVWGVMLGLLALLAGSIEGIMIASHGRHTVGAEDGLAGLPFVNWSRQHGDLRAAHFFAVHALQAFPVLGWLLSQTPLPISLQVALTCSGAALYLFVVWMLFRQAMAERPFLGAITH